MFLEYNWTACCYQPRFGDTFTAILDWRSFDSLTQADDVLALAGLRRGRKTDSRTWEIVLCANPQELNFDIAYQMQ